jgi:hypothetical protein
MRWAICSKIQAINHVPQTKDKAKRDPDADKSIGNFLKWGSHASIHFPIHLMGWGNRLGSPRIKSNKKAAGNAKTRDDNSILKFS